MEYGLKKYQTLKSINYFKNNCFFLIFQSSNMNSKEWVVIEQKIKKQKLKHCKILNGTTTKVLNNSIYKNYSNLTAGLTLFMKPSFKSTELIKIELDRKFKSFALLSIKLNDKIYAVNQIKNMKNFNYRKNIFYLNKLLEKSTKAFYVLKKVRNNVI